MGGRHGAALFCVANCDFGFAANCAGAANCASTSLGDPERSRNSEKTTLDLHKEESF